MGGRKRRRYASAAPLAKTQAPNTHNHKFQTRGGNAEIIIRQKKGGVIKPTARRNKGMSQKVVSRFREVRTREYSLIYGIIWVLTPSCREWDWRAGRTDSEEVEEGEEERYFFLFLFTSCLLFRSAKTVGYVEGL